jgi:nucleolar protein TMA23
MNAHALLTSQGWRGTGHSLHPTNDKTGLSRPLLVSRKDNVLGVGKKQHRTSDMWWMNAFDSSLKGLDTSKQGTVVQTVTSGGLDMVSRGGGKFVGQKGLYSSFVRGECLSGTIGEESSEGSTPQTSGTRTPDVQDEDKEKEMKRRKTGGLETKQERRARKAARRAARAKASLVEESRKVEDVEDDSVKESETKEERKERKRLKKLAKEAARNAVEVSSEKAKKKKRRKD